MQREGEGMKKIISLVMMVCLCIGMMGCGGEGRPVEKDVTALPHNGDIHIDDEKQDIEKKDEIIESDGSVDASYMKKKSVNIEDGEYLVGYEFSNAGEDDGHIATIVYDSDSVAIEDAQKYIDEVYGELEKDSTTGRYILRDAKKAWLVGAFKADNGKTRIVISRNIQLDEK